MRSGWRVILCLGLGAVALSAQVRFHAGAIAGVPITDPGSSSTFQSSNGDFFSFNRSQSEAKRLLLGPSIRLELVKGLGLEFDALYQRVDSDFATLTSNPQIPQSFGSFSATHADRWQFPLFVQYSHTLFKTKPFVQVGPAISTIGNASGLYRSTSSFLGTSSSYSENTSGGRQTQAGISSGLGVDLPIWRAHLRPEFRYSHWFVGEYGGVTIANPSVSLAQYLIGDYAFGPVQQQQQQQNEVTFVLNLGF